MIKACIFVVVVVVEWVSELRGAKFSNKSTVIGVNSIQFELLLSLYYYYITLHIYHHTLKQTIPFTHPDSLEHCTTNPLETTCLSNSKQRNAIQCNAMQCNIINNIYCIWKYGTLNGLGLKCELRKRERGEDGESQRSNVYKYQYVCTVQYTTPE